MKAPPIPDPRAISHAPFSWTLYSELHAIVSEDWVHEVGSVVDSEFDVAIQLTVDGGQHDTFLEFLDQLRASEDLRARYNQLKRTFDGRPMTEYREAKRNFIKKALGLRTQT